VISSIPVLSGSVVLSNKSFIHSPSNKSFIHSPVKEKAKTSKIEFWPYQQIRGDISVPGIIDKT
jgi:hypothetical protein